MAPLLRRSNPLILAAGVLFAACAEETGRSRERDAASDAAMQLVDAAVTDSGMDAGELDAGVRRESPRKTEVKARAPEADAGTVAAANRIADASVTTFDAAPADAASNMPAAVSCDNATIERADGEHACMHAESGPFAKLQLGATLQTAPDASRAHTAFQLSWPAQDTTHGYLRVRAVRAGTHAIFSAHAEVIGVTGASADLSLLVTPAAETYCRSLPSAALVELNAAEWSVIRLARMGEGEAKIVIEPLTAATNAACGCDDDAGCEEPRECRSSGPCRVNADCCSFCHDGDHCH